jgi:hypothetical protein
MRSHTPFKFEKWWLEIEGCAQVISNAWNLPVICSKAIDIWQIKKGEESLEGLEYKY